VTGHTAAHPSAEVTDDGTTRRGSRNLHTPLYAQGDLSDVREVVERISLQRDKARVVTIVQRAELSSRKHCSSGVTDRHAQDVFVRDAEAREDEQLADRGFAELIAADEQTDAGVP